MGRTVHYQLLGSRREIALRCLGESDAGRTLGLERETLLVMAGRCRDIGHPEDQITRRRSVEVDAEACRRNRIVRIAAGSIEHPTHGCLPMLYYSDISQMYRPPPSILR